MKKAVLTLAMIAAFPLLTFAQEVGNQEMLKDGRRWNYEYQYTVKKRKRKESVTFELCGDTVIKGQSCQKMYVSTPSARALYGCYYERQMGRDTRVSMEVWCYPMAELVYGDEGLEWTKKAADSPVELFDIKSYMDEWGALDFQSLLADRPGMKAYRNELYHSLSVRGSDIVEKNGVQRRRLSFALPDDLGSETWVAGIGDARWGILMPRYDISLTDERQLVFVSCQDGDKTLFRSEDFSMSGIGSGVTVYRPLVETGKKWIYKGSNDVTGQTWVVTMELKGDTLVAGKNCLKLYGYNLRNNGQDEYLGALMEKNRVVSCFLPGRVEPDTLYDFGLQAGDEGAFFCSDDNMSFDMTNIGDFYDVVDGTLVHGVMMYYPESSQSWSMMNLWIEGAGSVYGVLQPCFGDRVGGESMTLRWCGFNSRQIYRAIGFADDLKVEIDGIYYNLNSTNKVAVVTTKPKFYWEVEEVVIPESVTYEGVKYSVTSIDRGTFEQCDKLTSVVIPNSVTSIGDAAFGWCGSLTSVSFGNSVKSIGEFAFHNCYSLTSVEIPNSVTTIGDAAFGNCKGLTSLVLSNGLTNIGNQVFAACESLTSVDIPNSVDTISSLAFAGCRSLTSLNIPNSVSYIGQNAFSSCI